MKLTIESIEGGEGSVIVAVGVDEHGKRWRFAGDWRPMQNVAEALGAGETVEADVEPWQILGPA